MSGLLKGFKVLRRRITGLCESRGGNVSLLFGLSLVPLIGLVGLATDYGVSTTDKAKLDNAADAAAIAAVATAKAYIAANASQANLTSNAITAGITRATNVFNVNAGTVPFAQYQLQTPQLTRTGQTFKATVAYTATVRNNFGALFQRPTFNMSGQAIATADIPSYLDFYLLVDVSGSMGLPATPSGMSALALVNNDMWYDYQQGCQFACHFPGNNGWNLAAGKIQLRSDAVNDAICSLIQRASSPAVANQYRIGIYPFINQMATLSGMTSDMNATSNAANCSATWRMVLTNLLDTGTTQLSTGGDPSTGTGSGGTHFEVVFQQMQSTISPYGNGSSQSSSRPFVFLVTDGMENGQHYYTMKNGQYTYPGNPSSFPGYANAWWDGSQPSPIDPSQCQALKSAGATVSVLYIPYNQISYTNNSGYVAWENGRVNAFSPTLDTPLRACASPGFFYTANSPADITAALNAMFNQALQVAHLVQ